MTEPLASVLAALPGPAQQLAWIEELVALGVRRPGSVESARAQAWCAAALRSLGLDVVLQPVDAVTSHPGPATLSAWLVDAPSQRVDLTGLTMPFTTAADHRRFRLVPVGALDGSALRPLEASDAALGHVRLAGLPVAALDAWSATRHDPGGELASHTHTLPFGPALGKEIDLVVAAGGGALVGIVDAPWTTSDYFVPYDGSVRSIPAVWLDRDAGARLDELARHGTVEVELATTVEHRASADHNVIGELRRPGDHGDGWVVVGSHYDAPWASAVEDASGVAQVLAQATAWASVPADQRPASMAFVLTAAHMAGGAGARELLASWEHRQRIRFAIHLEHVAAEAEPDGAGGLRPTGRPEVRWWFASAPSESAYQAIVEAVESAVSIERLDRSLVLPPEVFGEMPPTDGGFYHLHRVPMVNLLAAPMYLFDRADTVEMIHHPSLAGTARAAARIIVEVAAPWIEASRGTRP